MAECISLFAGDSAVVQEFSQKTSIDLVYTKLYDQYPTVANRYCVLSMFVLSVSYARSAAKYVYPTLDFVCGVL
jgi:hypothetical protein